MKKILSALLSLFVASSLTAAVVIPNIVPDPEQTFVSSFLATQNGIQQEILQVTGALNRSTPGGVASSDTRTLYFWTPELNGGAPYTGPNWPYVFLADTFGVQTSLLGNMVFGTKPVGDYQALTINGFFVYQRSSHETPGDISGIGGNWPVIGIDGQPYTQLIPEPATTSLILLGIAGAVGIFFRSRRRLQS